MNNNSYNSSTPVSSSPIVAAAPSRARFVVSYLEYHFGFDLASVCWYIIPISQTFWYDGSTTWTDASSPLTTPLDAPLTAGDVSSCPRRPLRMIPEQWHLSDVLAIQPMFNPYRMGKNWMLVNKYGQQTYLKLLGTWSSSSSLSEVSNDKNQSLSQSLLLPGYGIHHENGISIHRHFNCSYWKDIAQWGTSKIKAHYGAPPAQLLNELYVYHVDRALGWDTVPAGKLVSIPKAFWSTYFAPHVCRTPISMRKHMKALEQERNGGTELRLLGWVQEALNIESAKASGRYDKGQGNWDIATSHCGEEENKSPQQVVLDTRINALESSSDYYKFMITARIARKWDMPNNCFFMQAYDEDGGETCQTHNNNNNNLQQMPVIRPMNVDNDRLKMDETDHLPPPWKWPCLVPEPIRSQILTMDNFTEAVWKSMAGEDLPLLGDKDLTKIRKMLSFSQPVFTQLYHQFQNC